jgi:energy-coupling factor transport system ATP-binding protein
VPEGILSIPELQAAVPDFPVDRRRPEAETEQAAVQPPQPHNLAIDVRNLHHTYLLDTPLAHPALDGASMQVVEGSVHGLIGKTGSGKSTLMQHLNALLRPQEGSIRVAGFDLNDPQVSRRAVVRQVGLVFQNPEAQFFEYYVGDEIAFGPEQLGLEQEGEGESLSERVRWAMEQVGLDFAAFKDRPLYTLSGGERRKVALASILALKPKILLLDEPTAGLDPQSRLDLLDRLAALRAGGMTLLISSHQMDDLAVLACRLTVFYRGRDVLSGPAAAVISNAADLQEYAMESPVGVQVANVLRARGWPVPESILSIAALEDWIASAGERVAR